MSRVRRKFTAQQKAEIASVANQSCSRWNGSVGERALPGSVGKRALPGPMVSNAIIVDRCEGAGFAFQPIRNIRAPKNSAWPRA